MKYESMIHILNKIRPAAATTRSQTWTQNKGYLENNLRTKRKSIKPPKVVPFLLTVSNATFQFQMDGFFLFVRRFFKTSKKSDIKILGLVPYCLL